MPGSYICGREFIEVTCFFGDVIHVFFEVVQEILDVFIGVLSKGRIHSCRKCNLANGLRRVVDVESHFCMFESLSSAGRVAGSE